MCSFLFGNSAASLALNNANREFSTIEPAIAPESSTSVSDDEWEVGQLLTFGMSPEPPSLTPELVGTSVGTSQQNQASWEIALDELLHKFDWHVCICPTSFPCTCGKPLVPNMYHHYAQPTTMSGFHCLSISRVSTSITPGFAVGLRQGLRLQGYDSELTQDERWGFFAEAVINLFSMTMDTTNDMGDIEDKIEKAMNSTHAAVYIVGNMASGVLCLTTLENCADIWESLDICFRLKPMLWDQTVCKLIDLAHSSLELLDSINRWINGPDMLDHPLCTQVLREGSFWLVQQVLFLIHAYGLVKSKGWPRAKRVHDEGGMPWQVGWFQMAPKLTDYIGRVINCT